MQELQAVYIVTTTVLMCYLGHYAGKKGWPPIKVLPIGLLGWLAIVLVGQILF